jgi:hypothetical protein
VGHRSTFAQARCILVHKFKVSHAANLTISAPGVEVTGRTLAGHGAAAHAVSPKRVVPRPCDPAATPAGIVNFSIAHQK